MRIHGLDSETAQHSQILRIQWGGDAAAEGVSEAVIRTDHGEQIKPIRAGVLEIKQPPLRNHHAVSRSGLDRGASSMETDTTAQHEEHLHRMGVAVGRHSVAGIVNLEQQGGAAAVVGRIADQGETAVIVFTKTPGLELLGTEQLGEKRHGRCGSLESGPMLLGLVYRVSGGKPPIAERTPPPDTESRPRGDRRRTSPEGCSRPGHDGIPSHFPRPLDGQTDTGEPGMAGTGAAATAG